MATDEKEDGLVALVVDNGSHMVKAGFAGDDEAAVVFPSVVLKNETETSVGDEALDKHRSAGGGGSLIRPIRRGRVKHWDEMETVWHYLFEEHLEVEVDEFPLLITEKPLTSEEQRAKMIEVLFEQFEIPMLHVAIDASLPLYAVGRTTGIVCDSGEWDTFAVPIFDGHRPHPGLHLALGGNHVTDHLFKALMAKGALGKYTGAVGEVLANDIKEKMCCVSLDYDKQLAAEGSLAVLGSSASATASGGQSDRSYALPDGSSLVMESERFRCPEIMFKPETLTDTPTFKAHGIHKLVFDGVKKCDSSVRRRMFQNIVLCGGNSMFPKMAERLQSEVNKLVPESVDVEINATDERKFAVWIGGSILASMSCFLDMCIVADDVAEDGTSVVQRKCS